MTTITNTLGLQSTEQSKLIGELGGVRISVNLDAQKGCSYWGSKPMRVSHLGYSDYVFHELSVFAQIEINDQTFDIKWLTGDVYLQDDFNYPTNHFEIHRPETSELLLELSYFEDSADDDEVARLLEVSKAHCGLIDTVDKMKLLVEALRSVTPYDYQVVLRNCDPDVSDYVEDYEDDEDEN